MEDNGADLISELPDELLLRIFSFLDEMVVVRSSVLSKRWRYLWTFISIPTEMKKDRSFYKELKKFHHQFKLFHEKEATSEVYLISSSISHTITTLHLSLCLPLFFMLEFKYFACINIGMTLLCMGLIGFEWYWSCSCLCRGEASFKKLQKVDFRLMSQLNSISINSPLMNPMSPVNFQPKHALAKSYVLFGMLVVMIISCSLTILNWKFELGGSTIRVYDFLLQSLLIKRY